MTQFLAETSCLLPSVNGLSQKHGTAHDHSADNLRHWRYISSFHGPWLQLPPEILDSLAHQNYTMPAPRLVDPAVFYDVVKIRKAVDEAAQDSVRASTGISNTAMNGRMDYLGAGGGPGSQLSKERIFKIRQKAVKLLAKAFTLDEVAASVATMQATSTVEDVGSHVLKREPNSNGVFKSDSASVVSACTDMWKMRSTFTFSTKRFHLGAWNNTRLWSH